MGHLVTPETGASRPSAGRTGTDEGRGVATRTNDGARKRRENEMGKHTDTLTAMILPYARRLRSRRARSIARAVADGYIRPLVPEGTRGWLASPATGESARHYAARAVETAAHASLWAGGLTDGTDCYPDAAAVASARAAIARATND